MHKNNVKPINDGKFPKKQEKTNKYNKFIRK